MGIQFRVVVLTLLLLVWMFILFNIFQNDFFLGFECCGEYKYLNNHSVAIINSLPHIIFSLVICLVIVCMKIDNGIIKMLIVVIIILGVLCSVFMTLMYLIDKDAFYMVDNMDCRMLEDTIYGAFYIIVAFIGLIKLIKPTLFRDVEFIWF